VKQRLPQIANRGNRVLILCAVSIFLLWTQVVLAADKPTADSGSLLKRDSAALFDPDFYHQFNQELTDELWQNFERATAIPAGHIQQHSWIIVLQLLAAVCCGWLLRRRARKPEPISHDWQFLFRHPWAGGLFIALCFGGLLYIDPPALWLWGLIALGTLTATILICAMLNRPRLRRVIIILATLFVIAESLQTIGLPEPFYRVFLVLVCLTATPLCLAAAKRQILRNEGRIDLLGIAFYLGTLVGIIGLIAGVVGFARLTDRLVEASLGTVFLILFAHMALHLAEGGVNTIMQLDWVRERHLVQQLGAQAEQRLNTLVRLVIFSYTFLFLLVIWNLFGSVAEAWTRLMNIEYVIGELHLSVEMVVLAVVILYLTVIISWFFQATLDTQVLTPRQMDLGVRDSIKRLLHYALVLIGFSVAISMAGIGLEKFAILAGALGVGIGFGLQNIVNNFVSGLILLFERPVKVGDTINIDDQWGTITKIGLRSTVFETLDRAEIIVPNSDLISQKVTNWTLTTDVSRIVLTVGVAYGSPLDKVLEILMRVAKEQPDVMDDPPVSAIFTGFGDSSLDFELRVWITDINKRLKVKSELGLAVDRHFREAEISIPFPQRDLHLRSIEANLHGLMSSPPPEAIVQPHRTDTTA